MSVVDLVGLCAAWVMGRYFFYERFYSIEYY